jgi:hypothetical protein
MTVVQLHKQNHSCKFAFQHQRIYTSTQILRHGMGSLRHTFHLRLLAGSSHCRLCYKCLFGSYTLRPWEETQPQRFRHIVVHSRMFLSARWEIKILFITFLVSILFKSEILILYLIMGKFSNSNFRIFPSSTSLTTFNWLTLIWTIYPLYFHFHCASKRRCIISNIMGSDFQDFGLHLPKCGRITLLICLVTE